MEHRNNSLLTPTQQGVLSKALLDVIMARNLGDIELYWLCLGSLYIVHPAKGYIELEAKLNPLFNKISEIKINGNDHAATQRKASSIIYEYKKANSDKIFYIIMASLRSNGYAEIILGATPKYGGTGTL